MWVCLEDNARADKQAPPFAVALPPVEAIEGIHRSLENYTTFIPLSGQPAQVLWGVRVAHCPECSAQHANPCVHWRLATFDTQTQRFTYWRSGPTAPIISVWLSTILASAQRDLDVPIHILPTLPQA